MWDRQFRLTSRGISTILSLFCFLLMTSISNATFYLSDGLKLVEGNQYSKLSESRIGPVNEVDLPSYWTIWETCQFSNGLKNYWNVGWENYNATTETSTTLMTDGQVKVCRRQQYSAVDTIYFWVYDSNWNLINSCWSCGGPRSNDISNCYTSQADGNALQLTAGTGRSQWFGPVTPRCGISDTAQTTDDLILRVNTSLSLTA